MIKDVMVAGRWCVRDGMHVQEKEIDEAFHLAMSRLNEAMTNGEPEPFHKGESGSTLRSNQGTA